MGRMRGWGRCGSARRRALHERAFASVARFPLASLLLVAAVAASGGGAGTERAGVDGVSDAGSGDVLVGEHAGRATLLVDGEPFAVRGAGLGDVAGRDLDALLAALVEAGGTAFRTWGPEAIEARLDAAERHGLRVLVGLDLGQELHGFDYGDADSVARQHERLAAFVDRHRDHPAVLGWVLGNEPNLAFGADGAPRQVNPAVYDAVEALARHVASDGPRRPTTLAFAFTATLADDVRTALERAPSLDSVAFQAYGALPAIPDVVAGLALDRPFFITEFGPLGHWEMPATDWGREIEEPSGVKAEGLVARMTPAVTDDPTGRLLGAFAFLWGQKQERTPTWYGLFVDGGERTAAVDELARLWRGAYLENRAPRATAITLDGAVAAQSVRLAPAMRVRARVAVEDPDGDALATEWRLRAEVGERSHGGAPERTPPPVPLLVERTREGPGEASVTFLAPREAGEYRLYAYSRDGHGGIATANVPFLVEAPPGLDD